MRLLQIFFLSAVVMGLAFSGCKTIKPISRASKLQEFPAEQLMDSVFRHSQFQYLRSKITVAYNAETEKGLESKNFSIQARFKKDSIIWVSITPVLGIEVFRLILTPDSVKLLNRLEQKYFVGSFEEANEILKMNEEFKVIQALITGGFAKIYNLDMYVSEIVNNQYIIKANLIGFESKKTKSPVEQETTLAHDIWRVSRTVLTSTANDDQIIAEYGAFQPLGNTFFSSDMKFRVSGKGKISIGLKWTKIEEKQTLRFPFKIPNKYIAY
jgi:hypothetical protein